MFLNWIFGARICEFEGLGTFKYQNRAWESQQCIDGLDVDVSIDGSKKELDEFAASYWKNIRPKVSQFWNDAVLFSLQELKNRKASLSPDKSDFKLNAVSIHKENSFDGGHLAFWFDIESDPQATYYVSFVGEIPSHFHRDS